MLEETDHKVNVIRYNDDGCTKDVTIGSAMMLITTSDGTEVLIHVNKVLLFEHGKSLFSTTQRRHFKHHVDEIPQRFGGEKAELKPLKDIICCSTLIMVY